MSRTKGLLPNGAVRLTRHGSPLYHYSGISCFAQYAVCVPNSLVKVDSAVSLEVAALFGCGVVTGVGAVLNTARLRPGDTAVVFGLGGVGLSAVMAARLSGASVLIGVDLAESKFGLGQELGCDHTLNAADPDLVSKIKDLAPGGVDFAFDVSGAESAVQSGFNVLRKGGELICVGLRAAGDMYGYRHAELVSQQKGIRGSMMGGGVGELDIPRYIRLFRDGKLPVDRLASGTMSFGDLNHALDQLHDGQAVRQILLPH